MSIDKEIVAYHKLESTEQEAIFSASRYETDWKKIRET
jgi:hypothetical protein